MKTDVRDWLFLVVVMALAAFLGFCFGGATESHWSHRPPWPSPIADAVHAKHVEATRATKADISLLRHDIFCYQVGVGIAITEEIQAARAQSLGQWEALQLLGHMTAEDVKAIEERLGKIENQIPDVTKMVERRCRPYSPCGGW